MVLSNLPAPAIAEPERFAPMYYFPKGSRLPFHLTFNVTDSQPGEEFDSQHMAITLYEKDGETKVRNAVYAISLRDIANNNNATLMRDVFYARNGTAMLRLVHSSGNNDDGDGNMQGRIIGVQEQFLNAWVADENITFYSPQLQDDAAYEVVINILAIDNILEVFEPETVPELRFVFDTGEDATTAAQVEVVPEFCPINLVLLAGTMLCLSIVISGMRRKLLFPFI